MTRFIFTRVLGRYYYYNSGGALIEMARDQLGKKTRIKPRQLRVRHSVASPKNPTGLREGKGGYNISLIKSQGRHYTHNHHHASHDSILNHVRLDPLSSHAEDAHSKRVNSSKRQLPYHCLQVYHVPRV